MKLITLLLSILFSLSALGNVDLKVRKVVMSKPMQINLIRLYQPLPSGKRMIAGFKETRIKEVSKTTVYLDDLREKLKSTGGKIRL